MEKTPLETSYSFYWKLYPDGKEFCNYIITFNRKMFKVRKELFDSTYFSTIFSTKWLRFDFALIPIREEDNYLFFLRWHDNKKLLSFILDSKESGLEKFIANSLKELKIKHEQAEWPSLHFTIF